MCNCESDLNCVPKYKPKRSFLEKSIEIGLALTIYFCLFAIGLLIYGILKPV